MFLTLGTSYYNLFHAANIIHLIDYNKYFK
nr:MAG TPA: hypothetical protein [Bacteriophage sp.]